MPDPHTSVLCIDQRPLSRSEIYEAKAQISHLLCSLLFTLFSSQHPFQYSAQAHYKRIQQETKYYFSQGSLDTSESPCGCDLENNYYVIWRTFVLLLFQLLELKLGCLCTIFRPVNPSFWLLDGYLDSSGKQSILQSKLSGTPNYFVFWSHYVIMDKSPRLMFKLFPPYSSHFL